MSESGPDLRVVPMPDGFELRDRRCWKNADGSQWKPEDAIYAASQQIASAKGRITSVVVIWREEFDEDNSAITTYKSAGPHGQPQLSVLNILGRMMGWR